MTLQPAHTKLLNKAASDSLRPLGLTQKGRSRTWLDDHQSWLVIVEFQPSSWSKGSYLNVGAMWLWEDKDYYSFDVGSRVEGFSQFHSDSQFQVEAERLAARAASQVTEYRSQFGSLEQVADHLSTHCQPTNPWHLYHAGIACGLAGRLAEGDGFFEQLLQHTPEFDWHRTLQAKAKDFRAVITDTAAFRKAMEAIILNAQLSLKLPPLETVEFGF